MRSSLASVLSVSLFCAVPLAGQDVYLPSDQVTAPKVIKGVKPEYTSEAMLRRIQGTDGTVVLQIDVLTDGTVGTVALVKSLDPGLDQWAAKSVKQWRFEPGTKDGKPVVVRINVDVPFGESKTR
jgi:TonB family protein